MKRFIIGALALGLTSMSLASEIHFLDSTLILYTPASNTINNHTASSTYTLSGRQFGIKLGCDEDVPVTGAIGGSALASVEVQMRVKWVGEPWETKPEGVAASWTVEESAAGAFIRNHILIPSTAAITIGCQTPPDSNGMNFNEVFNWFTPDYSSGQLTSYDCAYGGFEFHEENGEWISVGGFVIPVDIAVSGSIPSMQDGGIAASISSKLTLTGVGDWTVI